MGARTTALTALIATRRQGAWSDGILKEYVQRDRLERRDAALAATLTYGVMQNRMLLDYHIQHLLTGLLQQPRHLPDVWCHNCRLYPFCQQHLPFCMCRKQIQPVCVNYKRSKPGFQNGSKQHSGMLLHT